MLGSIVEFLFISFKEGVLFIYIYINNNIISINTINKSKIVHIHNFLFRFFVVSTKLTYSSSKFVLMFI